jgi:hypothetical protein
MPIWDALLGAGLSMLGSGAQAAMQGNMNNKTRQYSTEMYNRQRTDALADWNMANQYNSPAAMMERFKTAGLNPNLIYGQTNSAPPVRSSSPPSWNPTTPNVAAIPRDSVATATDLSLKKQAMDNMQLQAKVMSATIVEKSARTSGILAATARSKYDLQLASDLRNSILETAQLNIDKIRNQTDLIQTQSQSIYTKTLQEVPILIQKLANMKIEAARTEAEKDRIRQQISNMQKDGTLKQMDIDIRKLGIQPNDPMYMRMLGRIFNQFF